MAKEYRGVLESYLFNRAKDRRFRKKATDGQRIPWSPGELSLQSRKRQKVPKESNRWPKNTVESWRVISSIEQKTEGSERKQQMAKEYRGVLESYLFNRAKDRRFRKKATDGQRIP